MERELLIEKDRVQHIATSTNSTQAPSKRDASSSPTTPKASDIQQQHEYIPASNPALIHPHHAPPQSHDRNPSEPKDWKLNKLHESFNKGGKISQDAVELQQLKMEMEREKAAREHDMWKEVKSTSKRVEADREQLQRTIAGRSDVKVKWRCWWFYGSC